jgi:hypothetical protein
MYMLIKLAEIRKTNGVFTPVASVIHFAGSKRLILRRPRHRIMRAINTILKV